MTRHRALRRVSPRWTAAHPTRPAAPSRRTASPLAIERRLAERAPVTHRAPML